MFSEPSTTAYFGGGYHRGGGQYQALRKWCNHGLWDTRFNLTSNLQPPIGSPTNGITFGGTGGLTPWYGTHHGLESSPNRFWTLSSNVADAVSEFFIIARVRFQGSGTAHPLGRGRDGAGNGWSVQTILSATEATLYVVTTSGGDALRTATSANTRAAGQWYTYMAAYKSGSYVKVGVDGIWIATTSITATGLRSSSQGLSVNRNNSATATGDFDIKVLGLGTTIPPDADLLSLHREIVSLENVVQDRRVLMVPNVTPVLAFSANPVIWF